MDDREISLHDARQIVIQRLESLQLAVVEQLGKISAGKFPVPLGEAGNTRSVVARSGPGEGLQASRQAPLDSRLPIPDSHPPLASSPPRPLAPSSARSMLSPLM